jgi:undecaprenyl-diphosphatase
MGSPSRALPTKHTKGARVEDILKVIMLGIVQGITEFLPISSTGHLIVTSAALNFQTSLQEAFEIFIQIGSVIAVIAFYRADLLRQARTVRADPGVRRLWLAVLIAAIPAAVAGLLLDDFITGVLYSPAVVGVALIAGGIVFLIVERRPQPQPEQQTTELSAITPRQAILIGLAQMMALIPGVSRSGATIVGGLLSGLNRTTATQFSFYLSIPVLGGATTYSLLRALDDVQPGDLALLALGTLVTFVVSWLAIGWLLRYVARNNFVVFGYYRIAAGLVILLLVAVGFLR